MFTRRSFIQTSVAAAAMVAMPALGKTTVAETGDPEFPYPGFIGVTHGGIHHIGRAFTAVLVTLRPRGLYWMRDWARVWPDQKGPPTFADHIKVVEDFLPVQGIRVCPYTCWRAADELARAGLPVTPARRGYNPSGTAATKTQMWLAKHRNWHPISAAESGFGNLIPVNSPGAESRQMREIVAIYFALQAIIEERPDMLAAAGIPDFRGPNFNHEAAV